MTTPTNPPATQHLRASDARAAALLATEATQAITRMAEGLHQAVWRTLGAPGGITPAQTGGLTGLVYQSIGGVTRLMGRGAVAALTQLEPLLARREGTAPDSPERAAVIAALNGVMGDRLAAANNPLASPMTLRIQERKTHISKRLQFDSPLESQCPQVGSKILLVLHGLCMHDVQWNAPHQGQPVNHADALADALGYTPVYVRYNSGLHVSENGQELAQQLQDLLHHWPVPVTHITMLAHSMGGLVARSAVHAASQAGMSWPQRLKNMVFLGTPHHGAPLERAGNWVDVLLGSTPYSRPFAKLGQLRSAGVTDLRYGLVLDSDWRGHERFRRQPDCRTPVPLPVGVACFAIAATLAAQRSVLAERLIGDGLVPLPSALGQHADPGRVLQFVPNHQTTLYRTGHLQLLSSPAVTAQLLQWLA